MQVECPSCSKQNDIAIDESIVCSECSSSFSGHVYSKFKRPLMSATSALIIGAFGGYKANQHIFQKERYPVSVEYEMLDSCVNSTRESLTARQHALKTEVCICSLEKTMEEFSYDDYQKSEPEFSTRFRDNVIGCI